ncbi:efflux RND transporter periplasmic adaptor subunit [Gilvimarinus sp. DA14]|uniref:efflux RND transporter periplasmic adaptor subunit n=1 Tax=Gilvimarinus sp. DA14 TaxID=2956798 RepID=UPI0020B82260|nr:efflux RND transporter periplasmic adaptor subunit [Gilvimarinus sp. DA14]UTF60618.1 efflux RND transporter periplasmic adaptor subunit [Gilvimarinus sp. DA14]
MKYIISVAALLWAVSVFAQDAARVVVSPITADSVQRTLALTGTTRAAEHAELSSLNEGIVTALHAEAGDTVKKGDLLLELDAALAQAQVASLQAALTQQDVVLKEAQRRLDEARALSDKQFVAQTELAQRESLVAEAKANRARAQAELDYQQELVARHQLYAPFSGVIAQRNIDLGEWLNRGDPAFELVSNQTLWLDIAVPQEYVNRLQDNAKVKVRFDAHSDTTYDAQILAKIPVIDSLNRSFLLRLALPQTDELQAGLSARVSIPLNHSEASVVMIPSDALLRQPDRRYSVFVVEQNRAKRQSVEIGQRVNGHIEILSGLEVGQSVVTEGNELLQDGQTVEVVGNTGEVR